MSAPLSTGGAPLEVQTWQELEDVFARFGQLARSPVAPLDFYRNVLDQSVRALSAEGGMVWLRAPNGAMQLALQTGRASSAELRDEQAQLAHQALLLKVAAEGDVISVSPNASSDSRDALNLTGHVIVFAPVKPLADKLQADNRSSNESKTSLRLSEHGPTTAKKENAAIAVIEIWMRTDAGPATYRGCEQFLMGVCDIAADYHAFEERRRLMHADHHRSELLELGGRVHRQLKLSATAYEVANEGRRVVDCDRLSILMARGGRMRLLATSGLSRFERRSGAARRLQKMAALVRRTDEPAFYDDGQSDALPPVAAAIERHVEQAHARQVAIVPVRRPIDPSSVDEPVTKKRRRRRRPVFVLVAENFDSREGDLRREWLVEVAGVCATALYNAREADQLPFRWFLRPLGKITHSIASHLILTILSVAAIAAGITSLIKTSADFNVDAPGTLQPSVRRDVFAPRSGLVDEILVRHGENVAAGKPLVRLRDPALELEFKRVDGELETAQRQLEAVRATKTNRAVRDPTPIDAYRLSAEERELEQKLANARHQLELLQRERDQLVVTSPIAGRVLTWDVNHELQARPVERGEVLVTVADLSADWQLELDVPDDQMGYILAAQRASKAALPVRFRLASEERAEHVGKIVEVCQTANVAEEKTTRPKPTIKTKVAFDTPELIKAVGGELQPGVSVRAQIACGRRPLAYVWFHDIWDAAVEWWEF
jgi:multidrug efflux pump subunit AcrA (membrane-fusion protein)